MGAHGLRNTSTLCNPFMHAGWLKMVQNRPLVDAQRRIIESKRHIRSRNGPPEPETETTELIRQFNIDIELVPVALAGLMRQPDY